jgi:hypothetical protein
MLNHNLTTINDFAYLQIPIPASVEDLEGTVTKLKEKQAYFEALDESGEPEVFTSNLPEKPKTKTKAGDKPAEASEAFPEPP